MPIRGVITITYSGPVEAAGSLIAALTESRLAAEACSSIYPNEAHLGWVHVLAHEGTDGHPSGEFQQSVITKADGIATTFGFVRRSNSIVIGEATKLDP